MNLRNLVAGLVLCTVTAIYASLIGSIPDRTLPNTPGPTFMPWLVVAAMGALSVSLVAQAAFSMMRAPAAPPTSFASFDAKAGLLLVAMATFVAAIPVLGFLIAGVAFFACAMVLFGARRPLVIVTGAVAIPVVLQLLFRHVFSILLPSGIL